MSAQAVTKVQDDDVVLIKRIVARDRQAFEDLYHRYYQRLFGFLFKFLQHKELAEEVVNDVMLVVWRNATRYDPKRSRFSTWLFGIANNKVLKARASLSAKSVQAAATDQYPVDEEGPEGLMHHQQTGAMVMQALRDLSAEQRMVIELSYYHGFSYQEIAQIVECPVNTVKTRMFHARKRLERLLPRVGIRGHVA